MILKFLAVEGRVTPEHVELVWAAAQLKHCGRQVYDLLPGFIRALAPKPCAHLYSLLCSLPPKEHTEQVTEHFRMIAVLLGATAVRNDNHIHNSKLVYFNIVCHHCVLHQKFSSFVQIDQYR